MQNSFLLSYRRLRVSSLALSAAQIVNCRFTTSSQRNENATVQITEKAKLPRIELDASTRNLLNDLNMGMGSGNRSVRRKRPLIRDLEDGEGEGQERTGWRPQREEDIDDERIADVMTEAEELRALDEAAKIATGGLFDGDGSVGGGHGEEEYAEAREERRSPAAALGTKRIGSVELPEDLIAAIQMQVDNVDDPKLLRQAYLSALTTRTSPKLPSSRSKSKSQNPHQSSSLQAHVSSPRDRDNQGQNFNAHSNTRRKAAITPLTALLGAVVDLPAEFAAVRNVLGELRWRLGEGEWGRLCGADGKHGGGRWTIIDGGAGAGLWALQDTLRAIRGSPGEPTEYPSLQIEDIHGSRHILDLTRTLTEDAEMQGDIDFKRLYQPSSDQKPTVLLAPFMLMKLPNQVARARKIREMWASGAETIILIDEGSPDGFRTIAEARSLLLKLGASTPSDAEITSVRNVEEIMKKEKRRAKKARRREREEGLMEMEVEVEDSEGVGEVEMIDGREVLRIGGEVYYAEEDGEGGEERIESKGEKEVTDERKMVGSHVIAPCPHDGVCPLLSTRDTCHFSQRLQSPSFLRRTKHSKHGELDSNYSYVIIRRGARPTSRILESPVGLEGGVARDAREREALKRESERRGLIVPIKGGSAVPNGEEGDVHGEAGLGMDGVEVMRYIPHQSQISSKTQAGEAVPELDEDELRKQAYEWPRLVHPPLKRSGHVIMDTCHPSGSIIRLTIPKAHSKQAYYDARKVAWGDLFPHPPKGTQVVRTRGVKKLNKFERVEVDEDEEEEGDGHGDGDEGILVEVEEGGKQEGKGAGDVFVKTFG